MDMKAVFGRSNALGDVPAHLRCGSFRSRPKQRHPRVTCTAHPPEISRREVLLVGGAGIIAAEALQSQSLAASAADDRPQPALGPSIPTAQLAPDLAVSQVIKGCWQLSGGHRGDAGDDRTSGAAAVEDFGAFVRAGVTALDTADHYGPSEQLIGRYLARSGDRDKVQVLTKACIWGGNLASAGSGDVLEKEYIDVSRQRLGRQMLDLLQFYWHDYNQKNYVAAAQKLADMQVAGKIRHIGLTNFDVPRVKEFLDAGIPIVSHQVQYSLLDRRPENGMADYCAANGIQLLPYGVVAGGLLSDRYLGASPREVQLNTASKRKYASILGAVGEWAWFQRLLRTLHDIGAKHGGVSIANVASRWVLQRPAVGALILGARNAQHVEDHQMLFSFRLGADDDAKINEVLADARRPRGDCYTWERGGVF